MPSHGGPEIMVVPRQTRLSDPAESIESIAAALNLELQIYPLILGDFNGF